MDGFASNSAAALAIAGALVSVAAGAAICPDTVTGTPRVFWGDLHVHTAYSLDAYAFGASNTPRDAFAFARGREVGFANGDTARIDRPLDFAAVTDHAESFGVMYLCTDPLERDEAYCANLRSLHDARESRRLFSEYLLPLVNLVPPRAAPVCSEAGVDCAAASAGAWQRTQAAANEANTPCEFTAFIGYEWSATPDNRHWHRNIVFRSDRVPDQAFDYVRYPQVEQLWEALALTCRPEDGCDVLAIPHNMNYAEGGGFDVADASAESLARRARFERVAEVHQEKGNSECAGADPADADADCNFERIVPGFANAAQLGEAERAAMWQRLRGGYYRSLLSRGLDAFDAGGRTRNPLMLGAVGSTDTHFGTPGWVAEDATWRSITSLWQDDAGRLSSTEYNPGGLVGVWAEENTRASIFDALQRREAYATSGPRILLRFGIAERNACDAANPAFTVPMGGVLDGDAPPAFTVIAQQDRVGLAAIEIVKGVRIDGATQERVVRVATFDGPAATACTTWRDEDFRAGAPAYWYARVLEQPSPRWSKRLCERTGRCAEFPQADRMIQERAWSSPIWYLPAAR